MFLRRGTVHEKHDEEDGVLALATVLIHFSQRKSVPECLLGLSCDWLMQMSMLRFYWPNFV